MWGKKRTSVSYTPRSLKKPPVLLKRRTCNVDKAASNIKVVVRVRPPNDKDSTSRQVVQVIDEKCLIFDPKEYEENFYVGGIKQLNRDMLKKRYKNMEFQFDRVFDQDSNNYEIFEDTTQSLITSLLDGFNCSVFVYGATGAGKTYTMLGSKETPGIAFLTMVELYTKMGEKAEEYKFDIKISYLEVYNETVKDLICPSGPLPLLDDGRDGVIISGIKTHHIDCAEDLFKMLELGNRNRTQHPTDANAESSRSHAVFQVHLSSTHKLSVETKISKLTMIDLAGSERGAATGGKGIRFSEGSNINKSLLALGNCVDALAEGQKHIPYRNSKLTRILKDSLGGNCKTVMIVNVAPSNIAYEETFNTLNYANRAKKISNKATRNLLNVDFSAAQYKKIIEDLKQRIFALENENKSLKEGKTNSGNECGKSVHESRDIEKGREVLHCLYELEGKYNRELLMYQIKKKTLEWRIYQKQVISERFQLFEYMLGDSKSQSRMNECITNLKMQRRVYKDKVKSIQKLLKEKKSMREIALKEIESKGIMGELQKEVDHYATKLKEDCLEMQVKYYKDLLLKQQNEMTNSDGIIIRICKSMDYYYSILHGSGKVTEQMKEQHLALVHQLAGIKGVSWEDEPCEFTILRKIMDLSLISQESTSPEIQSSTTTAIRSATPPGNVSTAPPTLRSATPPVICSSLAVQSSSPEIHFSSPSPCFTPLATQTTLFANPSPSCAQSVSSVLFGTPDNKSCNDSSLSIAENVMSVKTPMTPRPVNSDSSTVSAYRVPSTPSLGLLNIAGYLSPDEDKSENVSPSKQEFIEVPIKNDIPQLSKLDFNKTFVVAQPLEDEDNDNDGVDTGNSHKPLLETVPEEPTDFQISEERTNPLNTTFDSPQPMSTFTDTDTVGSSCSENNDGTPSLNTTFTRDSTSPEVKCTDSKVGGAIGKREENVTNSVVIPSKTSASSLQKCKPQIVRSNLPIVRNGISSASGGRTLHLNRDSGTSGKQPNCVPAVKSRVQTQPSGKFKITPGATIKIQYNILSEKNKLTSDLPKVPLRHNAHLENKKVSSQVSSSCRTYLKENKLTASSKRNSPYDSPNVYTNKVKTSKTFIAPEKPYERKIRM